MESVLNSKEPKPVNALFQIKRRIESLRQEGSTPTKKKSTTPPRQDREVGGSISHWRQGVKELMAEIRHSIKEDAKDMKHAIKYKEFNTAHDLQTIIEENNNFLDELKHILDNCG